MFQLLAIYLCKFSGMPIECVVFGTDGLLYIDLYSNLWLWQTQWIQQWK